MANDMRKDGPIDEEPFVPEDDRIIGKAFRWSLAVIVAVAAGILLVVWVTRDEAKPEVIVDRGPIDVPGPLDQSEIALPTVAFTDITASAGIDFVHVNGAYGAKLLPETMGGGVAFLDYDDDGDQDLLFVNSTHWPDHRTARSPTMALYRNDGHGRFSDSTASAGLNVSFYGQGVAAGDYDNDGDTDLYLTALGPNRMYRNDGGRFRDVTGEAGLAGGPDDWSSSAGFFDYDNDGDLDLFVCDYINWSRDLDLRLNFTLNGTDRAYGPPNQYEGVYSHLYRNEGDGKFRDVSAETGIQVVNPATGKPMGKALAVTFADPDRDGWMDIFVSNDTVQNFAFRNVDGERFEESGAASGVGFNNMGQATGGMGIDAAEYNNGGVLGIGIANFANEHTSFYVQQDNPWQFVDTSDAEGIGSPSRLSLSFGLFFFDYDLDGRMDLLQANGHLEDEISQVQPSQHYRQPAQLFWNCGSPTRSCFAAVDVQHLGALAKPIVGRGASYADIDTDGDLDVVIAQTGGPPILIRNDQRLGHHWLRVRLVGTTTNRDAIGAEVELRSGDLIQRRRVMPTRSYLSQVELPVTFGIGTRETIDELSVHWPDGRTQRVEVPTVDTLLEIVEAGDRPT